MSDFELGVVLGFLIGAIQVGLVVTLLSLTGADERFVAWLERVRDRLEDQGDTEICRLPSDHDGPCEWETL